MRAVRARPDVRRGAAFASAFPALIGRCRAAAMAMLAHGAPSLGAFLVNLLLVRSIAPSEFGAFALVMSLLPFGANLVGACVVYPTMLRLAEPNARPADVVGAALANGLLFGLPVASGIVAAALVVAHPLVALAAALAGLAWFAQMAASRALMAQGRFAPAALGDLTCHLAVPLSVYASLAGGWWSLAVPFWSLAAMAGLVAVFQARQSGVRVAHLQVSRATLIHFWNLGRFGMVGPLCEGGLAQMLIWTLAAVHGKEAVAVYAALRSLIGVSNPAVFSTQSVLVPAVAHARHRGDTRSAIHVGAAAAMPIVVVALLLFASVWLFAGPLIALVYGTARGYADHGAVLELFVLTYFALVLAECAGAILRGLGKARDEARTQLVGGAAGALLGLPLAAVLGPAGAALVGAIAAGTRGGLALVWLRQAAREP